MRYKSRKLFSFIINTAVALFLLGLLLLEVAKAEDNIDITYFAISEHFSDVPYNQYDHQFIGVTYKQGDRGYTLATFINSYYRRSVLVSYSHYWELSTNLEASASLGLATGYDSFDTCRKNKSGIYFCPVVELGIKYTKFDSVQPKLSIFGEALVFSLSARF